MSRYLRENSVKYRRITADAYTVWRKPGYAVFAPHVSSIPGNFGCIWQERGPSNLSLFSQPPVFPGLRIGLIALTESPTYCCVAALRIKGLGALAPKRSRFPSNYSMIRW